MNRLLLIAILLPQTALAEMSVQGTRYLCERGVEVPVVYATEGADGIAVLNVDNQQIQLFLEPSASGVRYGWPSDGSNYVWLSKGDAATLLWKDGATGTETAILSDCKAQM